MLYGIHDRIHDGLVHVVQHKILLDGRPTADTTRTAIDSLGYRPRTGFFQTIELFVGKGIEGCHTKSGFRSRGFPWHVDGKAFWGLAVAFQCGLATSKRASGVTGVEAPIHTHGSNAHTQEARRFTTKNWSSICCGFQNRFPHDCCF